MNDIMSAKGRKNYLFAIPIMIGSVLLFLSLVWLAKGQPGGNNPSPALEGTNCGGSGIISCSEGSITLVTGLVTSCGLPITVTAIENITNGQTVTATTNSNCHVTFSTNPTAPRTNAV